MDRTAARGYRDAIGRFATGVTLVTGWSGEGAPVGCTANSVASVSLDPPLLLICMKRDSESLIAFERTGRFGVSVLPAGMEEVALRFAGEGRADRFRGVELRTEGVGSPILTEALGWMDCRVWSSVDAGDHRILIGEVLAYGNRAEGHPMVFYGSRFGTFDPGTGRP